jgi:uncharacterized protein
LGSSWDSILCALRLGFFDVMIFYMPNEIPTVEECLALLDQQKVPDHIIQHSQIVHKIARFLGQVLNQKGANLDQALIEAGAILHDVAKMDGLRSGKSHSKDGALLLAQLGYPEVAEIVRQHVVLDDSPLKGCITEASVVNYADKRVKHAEIVTLAERFSDLKTRYGKNPEGLAWLEEAERRSRHLEECIFGELPFGPERLSSLSGE